MFLVRERKKENTLEKVIKQLEEKNKVRLLNSFQELQYGLLVRH
jgi:hypothetical protein